MWPLQKQVSSLSSNALMLTEPNEALRPSAGVPPSGRAKRKAVDELQHSARAANKEARAQAPDSKKKHRSEDARASQREKDRTNGDRDCKTADKYQKEGERDDRTRGKVRGDSGHKDSRARDRDSRDHRTREGDSRSRYKDDRARDKDSRTRRDGKGEGKDGSSVRPQDGKDRPNSKYASEKPKTEKAASQSKPRTSILPSHHKKDDRRTESVPRHSTSKAERDSGKSKRASDKPEDSKTVQPKRQAPKADKQSNASKSGSLKEKHAIQAYAEAMLLPKAEDALQLFRPLAQNEAREPMSDEEDAGHEKSSHLTVSEMAASEMEILKSRSSPAQQPQLQSDIEQPISNKQLEGFNATVSLWGEPSTVHPSPNPTS